jgi:hypothetical protein
VNHIVEDDCPNQVTWLWISHDPTHGDPEIGWSNASDGDDGDSGNGNPRQLFADGN